MPTRKSIGVTLDEGLLARIDDGLGFVPRSRRLEDLLRKGLAAEEEKLGGEH